MLFVFLLFCIVLANEDTYLWVNFHTGEKHSLAIKKLVYKVESDTWILNIYFFADKIY